MKNPNHMNEVDSPGVNHLECFVFCSYFWIFDGEEVTMLGEPSICFERSVRKCYIFDDILLENIFFVDSTV